MQRCDWAGPRALTMNQRVIAALDFAGAGQALGFCDILKDRLAWVKVGAELFATAGPTIVADLKACGLSVFVDLKLFDIPSTVGKAVSALARCGADMMTIHALGGRRMLAAALEARNGAPSKPALLAVTVLTSVGRDDLAELGIAEPIQDVAARLTCLAASSGLDGMVCSPVECRTLKAAHPGLLAVVPGIRQGVPPEDDQRRVMGPGQAVREGADFIVVGRPLTRAADPRLAFDSIVREMEAWTNNM